MYLAFRKVDFASMKDAFTRANYLYIIPAIFIMFFSHWMRALRWQYLLKPIQKIEMSTLFTSLMIGYMANAFLPAHLGEFLRAYIVGKRKPISASAVFGTIVIERIIDVFALILLMALTMIVFPFPEWVRKSGYLSFIFIFILFMILILMKIYRDRSLIIFTKLTKPIPSGLQAKLKNLIYSFLDGIVALQKKRDYLIVSILSILIWACYGYIFQIILSSFDFINFYSLPWTTSLVLLVVTTISVLVPSSPGYVGTYHYLCQLSLGFFGVPESPALTFAFVMHGINFLPVLLLGLILISKEGISLSQINKTGKSEKIKTE